MQKPLFERGPDTEQAQSSPGLTTSADATFAELASTHGNRRFGQILGRMAGDGILPGGAVHPEVERLIAARRGTGAVLDGMTRNHFSAKFGDSLADVRIHTDQTADTLARSVSARAFTVGGDIYFAKGEYQPSTPAGKGLLAHELTHVIQQRGAPAGPLTVSDPGDQFEKEADRIAHELAPDA